MAEPNKITLEGEYQTRDGRPVRVLCVDAYDTVRRAIVLVRDLSVEVPYRYTIDGRCIGYTCDDSLDLIPVPKRHKRTVWVNLYPGERESGIHDNRQVADSCANRERIACLKLDLDFVEGEGL